MYSDGYKMFLIIIAINLLYYVVDGIITLKTLHNIIIKRNSNTLHLNNTYIV